MNSSGWKVVVTIFALVLGACGEEVSLPTPHASALPGSYPEPGAADLDRWMPAELPARLHGMTGDGVVPCGIFRRERAHNTELTRDEAPSVSDCIARARESKQSFLFVVWGPSVDSRLAGGLIGTADGETLRFSYDDAPCGLAGACLDWFRIAPCNVPPNAARLDPNMPCEKLPRGPTNG